MLSDDHERLKKVAQTLSTISSTHPHIIALKGWAVGATYAVIKAVQLDYRERFEWNEHDTEYQEVVCLLSEGKELTSEKACHWLAGFFFNSALQRIASFDDKMRKGFEKSGMIPDNIRRQCNKIKHEVSGAMYIRLKGDGVTLDELIHTLEDLSFHIVKNYHNYKAPINQER
jgi:hypothetical protein